MASCATKPYDPEAHGARCRECPLYGQDGPVPPEEHPEAEFVVLARSPGPREVEKMRPLVGDYGGEITQAVRNAGGKRKSGHWTNVTLCAGQGNEWWAIIQSKVRKKRKRIERQNKQEIKRAKAERRQPRLQPIPLLPEEACRPRLLGELKKYDKVIAIGKEAFQAVTGRTTGIMDARGTLNTVEHPSTSDEDFGRSMQVVPTTLDIKRFREIMRRDVARAVKWFRGELGWVEPKRVDQPTLEQLRAFLYDPKRPRTSVDVETKAFHRNEKNEPIYFDPLTDILRLIGFGDLESRTAYVLQFESVERPLGEIMVDEHGNEVLDEDGLPRRVPVTGPWEGEQLFSPAKKRAYFELIADWLEDIRFEKETHNGTSYDQLNIESEWERVIGRRVQIRNHRDNILAHHCVAPEYKHSLGFCSSFYTNTLDWKAEDTANTAQTNEAYRQYNARDDINTLECGVQIWEAVRENDFDVPRHWGYPSLIEVEHSMAAVARGMHRVGIYVDQSDTRDKKGRPRGRGAWDAELQKRSEFWKGFGEMHDDSIPKEKRRLGIMAALRVANVKDWAAFNPNSRDQISRLLFDLWDLPLADNIQDKDLFTKAGERSTNDAVLRSYVGDPRLQRVQRNAIHSLRMYRRWSKMRSTFIAPLGMMRDPTRCPNPIFFDYEDEDERDEGLGRMFCGCNQCPPVPAAKMFVRADGRIHPDVKAFGTKVGRLAGSRPNPFNFPSDLRSVFHAAPGHVLVGADQSALHLRIIADLWGIPSLLEAFLGKPRYHRGFLMGPHELFAELLFEREFMESPHGTWPTENPDGKWKGDAKGFRDTAKTTRYAGAYGAKEPTMYREITSAENKETGELPFAHMTMEQIEDIRETWLSKEPQWEAGWANEIEMWRDKGFLETPLLGRRAWFLEAKETDIVNFRVLATEADGMNIITSELADAIPFEYAGPGTGLIHQNYDSVCVECPPGDPIDVEIVKDGVKQTVTVGKEAWRVSNLIREIGSRKWPGLNVPWEMEPAIGLTLDAV